LFIGFCNGDPLLPRIIMMLEFDFEFIFSGGINATNMPMIIDIGLV
jgi:hypothetical protein